MKPEDKAIGGSNVCLTCECHCAHIDDLEFQIGEARSILEEALKLVEQGHGIPVLAVLKTALASLKSDKDTIYEALKAVITTQRGRIKTTLSLLDSRKFLGD